MDELASLLMREKQMLEVLVYRLDGLHHVLSRGDTRFITWATAEVEHAASILQEAERERASHVEELALERGVRPTDLSLRAVAETSETYAPLFEKLRAEFLALTDELESLVKGTRAIATREVNDLNRILDRLAGPQNKPMLYGPTQERRRTSSPSRYEAVL